MSRTGGARARSAAGSVISKRKIRREGCLKASNEVNAETSASNPGFKKILDSQMDFRNDGNLWWQVAEYSYETFMIRTRPKG